MDYMNWGWPQYVMAICMALTLLGKVHLSGSTQKISGTSGVFDFLFIAVILYMGGFWS